MPWRSWGSIRGAAEPELPDSVCPNGRHESPVGLSARLLPSWFCIAKTPERMPSHESPNRPSSTPALAPLKRWGGIVSGFARTYSRALGASRAEVIDAVDGPQAVDTLVVVNGHRGTDHSGAAPNRICSPDHPEHDGVDRVFIAATPSQLEAIAERVGADVRVS